MPRTIKVNYKNLETKEFLTGTSLKKIIILQISIFVC